MVSSSTRTAVSPEEMMAQASERSRTRQQRSRLILTTAVIGIAAVTVVMNLTGALGGSVPALTRLGLGIFGIAAGICMATRRELGWRLAFIWALVQIPYVVCNVISGDPVGLPISPTTQLFDIPLSFSETNSVNRVMTNDYAVGINLVGVALAAWIKTQQRAFAKPD